jgi:hypothetical protein
VSSESFIILWAFLQSPEEVETIGVASCVVVAFGCCGLLIVDLGKISWKVLAG